MTARPVRTCVGCRERFVIETLVRITIDERGQLVPGGASNGRGVWLCSGSHECVEKAERSKAFGRGLKVQISQVQERSLVERLLIEWEKVSASSDPSTVVS